MIERNYCSVNIPFFTKGRVYYKDPYKTNWTLSADAVIIIDYFV